MGWKKVKEHYRIEHTVQVCNNCIWIGAGYIPDGIVISFAGQILKRFDSCINDDMQRYQQAIERDSTLFRQLLEQPDQFTKSITVYTFKDGDIVEKLCEELGWPNVTHDGLLMYNNYFSTDKQVVIAWAKANAAAAVAGYQRSVADAEKTLAEYRTELAAQEAYLAKLNALPTQEVASN